MQPSVTSFPPSTFDFASGIGTQPGTPIPKPIPGVAGMTNNCIMINNAGTLIPVDASVGVFEEYSDSPTIESSEQSTIVHRFYADTITAQSVLLANPRGSTFVDSQGYYSRVVNSSMQPIPRTGHVLWNLNITSEAMGSNGAGLPNGDYYGFSTQPDEFSVDVVEINPAIEKHPRYSILSYLDRWNVRNADVSDNIDYANLFKQQILNLGNSPEASASLELLYKKHKGEDSFYMGGYKITWSTYFWYPPSAGINPGGYIEDPIFAGGLPYQFWSTNGTNDIQTNIFFLAQQNNLNMYPFPALQWPYGISWLRQMDSLVLVRTWFKLTRSWLGAPLGTWDFDLYGSPPTPLQANETAGSYANLQ